jgi:hypothetical protein
MPPSSQSRKALTVTQCRIRQVGPAKPGVNVLSAPKAFPQARRNDTILRPTHNRVRLHSILSRSLLKQPQSCALFMAAPTGEDNVMYNPLAKSPRTKMGALNDYQIGALTTHQVCKKWHCSRETLYRWIKEASHIKMRQQRRNRKKQK